MVSQWGVPGSSLRKLRNQNVPCPLSSGRGRGKLTPTSRSRVVPDGPCHRTPSLPAPPRLHPCSSLWPLHLGRPLSGGACAWARPGPRVPRGHGPARRGRSTRAVPAARSAHALCTGPGPAWGWVLLRAGSCTRCLWGALGGGHRQALGSELLSTWGGWAGGPAPSAPALTAP